MWQVVPVVSLMRNESAVPLPDAAPVHVPASVLVPPVAPFIQSLGSARVASTLAGSAAAQFAGTAPANSSSFAAVPTEDSIWSSRLFRTVWLSWIAMVTLLGLTDLTANLELEQVVHSLLVPIVERDLDLALVRAQQTLQRVVGEVEVADAAVGVVDRAGQRGEDVRCTRLAEVHDDGRAFDVDRHVQRVHQRQDNERAV